MLWGDVFVFCCCCEADGSCVACVGGSAGVVVGACVDVWVC